MTQNSAIIIALGQPSDPEPHDATMQAMAGKIAALLPGWTIRGATLESPASMAAAAEGLDRPMVYPLLLVNGFFMAQVLPKRLARLLPDADILPPFGEDAAIPRLVTDILVQCALSHHFAFSDTSILLAAHGSEVFPASRLTTEQLAREVESRTSFKRVIPGYIEERPYISESATDIGQAICLPVFALSASHVAVDVPEALAKASFQGIILPPLGMHENVPPVIASALQQHAMKAAA
jgi:sirohydrochlorin ferrochelatase